MELFTFVGTEREKERNKRRVRPEWVKVGGEWRVCFWKSQPFEIVGGIPSQIALDEWGRGGRSEKTVHNQPIQKGDTLKLQNEKERKALGAGRW